jgi:hypothetical protein
MACKIEFTQILDDLEKRTVPTQEEEEIVETEIVAANEISDDVLLKLDMIEQLGTSSSAIAQSKRYAKRFKAFLRDKKLRDDIEKIPENLLSQYLRYFYSEVRSETGQYLSPSTLGCMRAGIQRYLRSAPVNRIIDIVEGKVFTAANTMIKVMGTNFLRSGGHTTSFAAIEDGDLRKISAYFDRSTPTKLQEEVAFNLLYYFGERGRETEIVLYWRRCRW